VRSNRGVCCCFLLDVLGVLLSLSPLSLLLPAAVAGDALPAAAELLAGLLSCELRVVTSMFLPAPSLALTDKHPLPALPVLLLLLLLL
jgi:hypothetical protein